MGLTTVRAGELAAVVTSLEMVERPGPRPVPESQMRLVSWPVPQPEAYRALFRQVGAPWLWFSRLAIKDRALSAIIGHKDVEVYSVVDAAGFDVGMLELNYRVPGECELAYFGLVPAHTGMGLGNWLMAEALIRAWRSDIRRVWVHTCTLDHPSALGFYRKHGFVAYRRQVETFADPRITGALPVNTAPQVPLISAR